MSRVALQIGGRPYTVTVADGEEQHLRHLAAIVDATLTSLGPGGAPGDAKNLLFAALILADEADEARRAKAAPTTPEPQVSVAHGLEALAERVENLAQALEDAAARA